MSFESSAIDIPVLDNSVTVYAEPSSSTNTEYNPFREDYAQADVGGMSGDIDLSTYDVPYDGGIKLNDHHPKTSLSRPSRSSGDGVGNLRDIAWSAMSFDEECVVEIPSLAAEEDYREIASVGIIVDAEESESHLEFIESSASMQQAMLSEEFMAQEVMSLGNGYAVAICCGRAMLVELSRAKERILFDALMRSVGSASAASQRLLFPERLTLSVDDYQLLEEHQVEFAALGFDIELMGGGNVELSGIPSSMVGESVDNLLYDLLREVEHSGNVSEKVREDMVRVMAVKGSRRVGRGMSSIEAKALVDEVLGCENYSFSPSGKPILTELTMDDLKLKLS
jgi:DNA mismatch repair protein MutL